MRVVTFLLCLFLLACLAQAAWAQTVPEVTIARDHAAVREGGEAASFTLTASPAPNSTLPVTVAVSGACELPAGERGNRTVDIPSGETNATFTVPPIDDDVYTGDCTVTARVLDGQGYTVGNSPDNVDTVVRWENDPRWLTLSAATYSVEEGSALAVTLKMDPPVVITVDVGIKCTHGTTAANDFTACPATVRVPANASAHNFTIRTTEDTADELDETFTVAITSISSDFAKGTPSSATVTITDDDVPVVSVDAGVGVTEGTALGFTLSANTAPATDLAVNLDVSQDLSDVVAADDLGDRTVTILAGKTSASFTVPTAGDSTDERNGLVAVSVEAGDGYTPHGGADGMDSGVVSDDDPTTVTLAVPDATAREGSADTARISVTLSRGLGAKEVVTASLAFAGGAAGTDFTLALPNPAPTGVTLSGTTVTFTGPSSGVSASAATLTLTALTDADMTDDTVTVSLGTVTATNLAGGNLGKASRIGNGRIALLDIPPVPGVTVSLPSSSLALAELDGAGAPGAGTYTVVLDTDPGSGVTVAVTAASDDTGAATVAPPTLSFTGSSGGDWATPKTFTVTAVNDGDATNESLSISHSASATGDADPYHGFDIDPVAVAVADAGHGIIVGADALEVPANGGTATYTLRPKGLPGGTVTVAPASGDTAKASVSGPVSFDDSNWETAKSVTVTGKGASGDTAIVTHSVTAATAAYPAGLAIDRVRVTLVDGATNPPDTPDTPDPPPPPPTPPPPPRGTPRRRGGGGGGAGGGG
ncbi:MAG: hypothetical protein OXJ53_05415, partial [Gammaproteobacteria bacterium]|nr:hypothetical protein [Gammaproteobacteria bacterium]